jgi:hypothetical protein
MEMLLDDIYLIQTLQHVYLHFEKKFKWKIY